MVWRLILRLFNNGFDPPPNPLSFGWLRTGLARDGGGICIWGISFNYAQDKLPRPPPWFDKLTTSRGKSPLDSSILCSF